MISGLSLPSDGGGDDSLVDGVCFCRVAAVRTPFCMTCGPRTSRRRYVMFKRREPRRSDEKTPGYDQTVKKEVVTGSVRCASAVIELVTKIIKLIDVATSILGG